MIIAGVISGFGNSLIWVAYGVYIAECANFKNKGLFYSVFWVLYQCNQIIGNVLSAEILGEMDQKYFFIVMGSITLLSSLIFIFLPKPIQCNDERMSSN